MLCQALGDCTRVWRAGGTGVLTQFQPCVLLVDDESKRLQNTALFSPISSLSLHIEIIALFASWQNYKDDSVSSFVRSFIPHSWMAALTCLIADDENEEVGLPACLPAYSIAAEPARVQQTDDKMVPDKPQ